MEIRLPRLGEGADSGSVVNVLVKEGDQVTKDQTLIELENEKAVAAIPSTAAGTVTKVHVRQGDKISVGQILVSLSESGNGSEPSKAEAAPAPRPQPVAAEPLESPAGGAEPAASPSIRKTARELGIDLRQVRGSARGGRITIEDLRAYIQRLQQLASQPGSPVTGRRSPVAAESVDFSKWGPVTKTPMSSLRQTIARKMVESWTTIPHVTQFDEADITDLLELKKTYDAAYGQKGGKLTVTAFILKAAAAQLKAHPKFNVSLDEAAQEIVQKGYYHLGIAVDTEAGLLVPVLKDVDKKPLLKVSQELNDLAERARSRKVTAEELAGGTFSISNQGGIGGGHFTPIIKKPEVAILGVGRGALKPVARSGRTETRMMLPLALSYDHRVIDGADAARFMRDLVQALERFPEGDVKI